MRHLYAVETESQLLAYQAAVHAIQPRLEAYSLYLRERYEVRDLPRAVVWTSREAATHLLSGIPVPAYTNEFRIVITPDLTAWRDVYLHQLDGLTGQTAEDIRAYYRTALNENHLLAILGHELAHHSELFLDDFDNYGSSGVWFEEGMVEYIGRSYFLTPAEFSEEARINRLLVGLLEERYGGGTLEDFGAATYEGDYAGIFFAYWRAFLAVQDLVERLGGTEAVFRSYRRWAADGSGQTLTAWFRPIFK